MVVRDSTSIDLCRWLRDLHPLTEPPQPASSSATIADAVDRIGIGPVQWACELSVIHTNHILDVMPELGGGPEQFDLLRMGIESQMIQCLLRVSGATPDAPAVTDEALLSAVQLVRRGISLDRVLRGARLGQAQMARGFLSACRELVPASDCTDHMQCVSEQLFEYFDDFCGSIVDAYIHERDRWMTSAAAARDEAVRQILNDEPVDTAATQKVLDYYLNRDHLALTLWYEPSFNRVDTSQLQIVAHDLLLHLGARQQLIVPVGAGRLWAWGNQRQFGRSVDVDVSAARPAQRDVRVAVGMPADGVDGFRRSHRDALAAEKVARCSDPGKSAWASSYAEVAIPAMLTADLDAARQFVQRELGPLAADTAHAADLRATLLSYFEEESSPFAAARRLHVARNTVGYRVKRATELLGYDLSTRRYSLHTALILADRFAALVLEPVQSG
jgi:hypothetical protein